MSTERKGFKEKMKRIDFEHGSIPGNILNAAIPMLVAQLLSLLYNIIDRIYIARIPHIGTTALGAVGLCFPIIVIITAFSNLFGSGGAPLFSIRRGENNSRKASEIMNTSYTMVCGGAIVLMVIGFLFARPILRLFGASESALVYAYPYLMIYLVGITKDACLKSSFSVRSGFRSPRSASTFWMPSAVRILANSSISARL